MPKFSANLGFLWAALALPEAIVAAKAAGFDAVECHWPYDVGVTEVKAALNRAGLQLLGLNTLRGFMGPDDFGVAAVPGREDEARHYIDRAIGYSVAVRAKYIHVMAGVTDQTEAAEHSFLGNLTYACDRAQGFGITVLIEPINQTDFPNYYLHTLDQAVDIQDRLVRDNLKILFDCYHMQIIHGAVLDLLKPNMERIGHIQIASVPDRTEPDGGTPDYTPIMAWLDEVGYAGYVGAEYRPRTTVEAGLSWLDDYK